ncbi:hypothetical protein AA313_de0204050 [Arthrobotrys entomopaga]|nr:hypothetical protein AA313_de0204050 [Arthrobotrys entomopaga]
MEAEERRPWPRPMKDVTQAGLVSSYTAGYSYGFAGLGPQNEAIPKPSEMTAKNNTFTTTEHQLYPDRAPTSNNETSSPPQSLPFETFSPVQTLPHETLSPLQNSQNLQHETFSPVQKVPNYGYEIESLVTRTQSMRIPRRPVYSETQTDIALPQAQAQTEKQTEKPERPAGQSTPPPVTFEDTVMMLGERPVPAQHGYQSPMKSSNALSLESPAGSSIYRTDSVSSYPSAGTQPTTVHTPDSITIPDDESDGDSEDELFELQRAEFMVKRANELYKSQTWNQAEEFIQSLVSVLSGNTRLRAAKPGGLSKSHWLMMLVKVQASQQKWTEALNTTNLLSVTDMLEDAVPFVPGIIEFWQSYFTLKLGRYDKARSLCRKVIKLRRGNPQFREQHDHAISLMRLIVGVQKDNVEMEFYQSMLSQESYDNEVARLIGEKDLDIILTDIYLIGPFSQTAASPGPQTYPYQAGHLSRLSTVSFIDAGVDVGKFVKPSLWKIDGIDYMEPFHQAVYRDNLAIVKHFTTLPDIITLYVNRLTPGGWSPIELAIAFASPEMVGCLLAVGATIKATSSVSGREDLSTVHQICLANVKNRADKIKAIQESPRANAYAQSYPYSAQADHAYLLNNPDHHKSTTGRTPLMTLLAETNGEENEEILEVIKLFYPEVQRAGLRPENTGIRTKDFSGATALHYAASNPSLGQDIIRYILDSGAYAFDKNKDGKTAWEIAQETGCSTDVVELLK